MDRFDDVSNHVLKGIEFCEKYEDFYKKRCSIEYSYAKSLKKLIESFEPKKKDADENNTSQMRCFVRILSELKDKAGQHELIADDLQSSVLKEIGQLVKSLKEERRKCIDNKETFLSQLSQNEDLLEKAKSKYERAFKEKEKAEEVFQKVNNDGNATKNEVRRQEGIRDQKRSNNTQCEADYGKQLCEANKVKNLYFTEQLPLVLDTLQNIEVKRIESFKNFVLNTVKIENSVLPRIKQCNEEVEKIANAITPVEDTNIVVSLYKTGYSIPGDYIFENLDEKNSPHNGSIRSAQTSRSITSNYSTGSTSNGKTLSITTITSCKSQTDKMRDKYNTMRKIKKLITNKSETDIYSLPPQQLKREMQKKIDQIETEIKKLQKEKEGIIKLKDVYSQNPKIGDAQATHQALEINEERIGTLTAQLNKYQSIINEVDLNGSYSKNTTSTTQNSQQYSSSGYSSGSGETLPTNLHIYQSPSQNSVNSPANSMPGTPISHHRSNYGGSLETPVKSNYGPSNGAYAVSPVSHLSINNNNRNNTKLNGNESFDDDDDDDCYENPSVALRGVNSEMTNGGPSLLAKSGDGIIYADSQYDRVDAAAVPQNTLDEQIIGTALVIYAFSGSVQNAMSVHENESLSVLEKDSGDGWTLVKRLNGEKGYVPTDYIRIVYY